MNEQTRQLIEKLAEKLGTTADHVWSVLTRQAKVELFTSAMVLVLTAGAIVIMFKWWASYRKRFDDVVEGTFPEFIGILFASIGTIALFVTALGYAFEIPTLLLNPEFWALKQILEVAAK